MRGVSGKAIGVRSAELVIVETDNGHVLRHAQPKLAPDFVERANGQDVVLAHENIDPVLGVRILKIVANDVGPGLGAVPFGRDHRDLIDAAGAGR